MIGERNRTDGGEANKRMRRNLVLLKDGGGAVFVLCCCWLCYILFRVSLLLCFFIHISCVALFCLTAYPSTAFSFFSSMLVGVGILVRASCLVMSFIGNTETGRRMNREGVGFLHTACICWGCWAEKSRGISNIYHYCLGQSLEVSKIGS
jgi:hypothetical protein